MKWGIGWVYYIHSIRITYPGMGVWGMVMVSLIHPDNDIPPKDVQIDKILVHVVMDWIW
jgi:hypothetical protein